MIRAAIAAEVKALIRFYEKRGADWLDAAEFTLAKHSGRLEMLLRTRRDYIMIPKPHMRKKGSLHA